MYSKKDEEIPTGSCLILITPDSERTMCTFLGIAGKINDEDINENLVKKSEMISDNFDKAEYDALVSTGEIASCALIAARLKHIGFISRSWQSWQIPIITFGSHSNSRIQTVNIKK